MKQADYAISIENLSEDYHVKFIYPDRAIERRIRALDKINFTVTRGESVAILGPNGAGKTTLLKIIAGMLKPDYGHITVNGKVRGIFALEAGFIADLTGYQNLKMAFKLYDINDAGLDQIVEFSELGDFIYAPLKSYSQGMYLRLAFSIAINTAPDILIIDDILAVGDYYFQRKCIAKIKELI
ncbi:MAG: ATP-binding cassette domain-containing protein, partial [Candidatus Omnitrophica bacterium]|nr:ATP-binding cassette domain-containing protein [Candidatus Omnitrophota bacterium]